MLRFADRVIFFNRELVFKGNLPDNFQVINPFIDNPETMVVMSRFYHKYYNDNKQRRLILGINPSRKGAGVTGVPFTDTKRLATVCGIEMKSAHTHEVSSVFVYDMIEAYGGPESEKKRLITEAVDKVATKLGNTRAVCKKYYIHPEIITSYENGALQEYFDQLDAIEEDDNYSDLTKEEKIVLSILENK
jgi:hypothetical protein